MSATTGTPYIGMSMEGPLATWYAKTTGKDMAEFQRLARELAAGLPNGARVLEVAPGPGFLSVALAKLGPYEVTGVDISKSFVRMASEYARKEGVRVQFIHGSASDLPLQAGSFDLIVCRAAFEEFSEPLLAIKRNAPGARSRAGRRSIASTFARTLPGRRSWLTWTGSNLAGRARS